MLQAVRWLAVNQIRRARREELETLRGIGRDAGRAFAEIGMAEVAGDEPLSVRELEWLRSGRTRVGCGGRIRSPGRLSPERPRRCCVHIEQVSVAPAYARRGVGAAFDRRPEEPLVFGQFTGFLSLVP